MRTYVSILVACAAVLMPRATHAQPADPQRPTFRTGVELVAVDVSVLDRDGRPVKDLSRDDFLLRVDGAARRLVSAEFIPLGAAARPRPAGMAATHYSTNEGAAGGRLIVFVVDRGNIRRGEGRPLMEAASRFIGQLEPSDRIALAVIPDSGPYADFTTDHRSVQRTIETMLGSAGQAPGSYTVGLSEALAIARQDSQMLERVTARECQAAALIVGPRAGGASREYGEAMRQACRSEIRAQSSLVYQLGRQQTSASLAALRQLLARLALTGGPKTLVLLSQGLFVDMRERGELEQVAADAAAADATFYALGLERQEFDAATDRQSPTVNEDRVLLRQGLEMLVGLTRGQFYAVATSGRAAFDRIARELSGYYLLSFEPEGNDRDGAPHAIDVDVRVPGVEVRARRRFVASVAKSRPTAEELATVLRTPLPATELIMRVATFTYPGEGRQLRLVIAADIEGAFAAGSVPCGFSLTDASGQVVGAEVQGPSSAAQPIGNHHAYLASFVMIPGTYTLKLAAVDDLGRHGSVEHHIDARLTPADQLQVGDLMLANAAETSGREVRPSIDGRMTSDSVGAYVEFASDVGSLLDATQVTFEVARSENSEALARSDATLSAPTVRRRVAEGRLDTELLPPGDYVARAVITVKGRRAARASRPFRLERPLSRPALTTDTATPGTPPARARLRGPAGITGVKPFDIKQVLAPEVLGYFLDRLPGGNGQSLSPGAAQAGAAARNGDFESATRAVARADQRDVAAVFLRGVGLLATGDPEGAAREFRAALKLSPEFFPAAFYLGACYAAGGRDDEAAGAWQTSLVTEAEAPFVYQLLGDALLRTEQGEEAATILEEARGLWPDDPRFLRPLAVAHAAARQHAPALNALEQHLAHARDDRDAWLLAAWLVYDARLSGRPLGTLEEDLRRLDTYGERYRALGGRDTALIDQWREAVQSHP